MNTPEKIQRRNSKLLPLLIESKGAQSPTNFYKKMLEEEFSVKGNWELGTFRRKSIKV